MTTVNIDKFPQLLEHNHSILTIGSCFAENIGSYFSKYKFRTSVNPFGVLYNSASIKNSIQLAIKNDEFKKQDLIFDQDEWHSFFHHSDFSHHEFKKVLANINEATKATNEFLRYVDWVIISLGTSFIYKHNEKDIIVSNCHKIPQKEFSKELLSINQNRENLSTAIDLIRKQNPNAKFILTVSPIRHWKDGANQNQISKASLQLAVNEVVSNYDNVFYFPSYEIVIDELRDYRFYAKDMLHPNNHAVEYIWDRFVENCLSNSCKQLISEIDKILSAAKHRVRNPMSKKNKEFAVRNISKIRQLIDGFPHLNFDEELNKFYSYLDE